LSAGCVPHLHADDPDELTERIGSQERLHPAGPDAAERTPPCPPPNPALPS
jgi:hypothetical protein